MTKKSKLNPIESLDGSIKGIIHQIETLDPESDQARQDLVSSCDQALDLITPMLDKLFQIQAEFAVIDQINDALFKMFYVEYLKEKYPSVFKTKE